MLATIAVLALVPAASAAEPPAGVVLDATVSVTATAAAEDGGSSPLADATVTLIAYVTDFPEDPIQELTATTGLDGSAAFEGVARADGGAPPVHLAAQVLRETIEPDGDCVQAISWFGMVSDVESVDGLDIQVETFPSSSIACPPPDGGELPAGLAADATVEVAVSLGGEPVEAVVHAVVSRDGWAMAMESVSIDGTAVLDGVPRPDDGGAPVEMVITASAGVPDAIDGCTFDRQASGGTTLSIDAPGPIQAAVALARDPFEAPGATQVITVAEREGGAPVTGSSVFVRQEDPADPEHVWSCHTTTDAAGHATVPFYAWGAPDAMSIVDIETHGPVTSTEVRGECVLSFGHHGVGSFATVDGIVADPVTIVTDIIELDAVCSTTGTPPPGGVGSGGSPTLPPTDLAGAAAVPSGGAAVVGLLAALGVVSACGLGLALSGSARRRG